MLDMLLGHVVPHILEIYELLPQALQLVQNGRCRGLDDRFCDALYHADESLFVESRARAAGVTGADWCRLINRRSG